MQDFFRKSLQQLHVEALVEGNLTQEEASQLLRDVVGLLKAAPLSAAARPVDQIAQLPEGKSFLIKVPLAGRSLSRSPNHLFFSSDRTGPKRTTH